MPIVDLNSDLAEGYGAYKAGDDEAMLSIVTSANVACGFHAGDPEIMNNAFTVAKAKGVAVGAHPGFPDLWGFGRRRMPFTPAEIERLVAYQIGAAQGVAAYAGHRITYVKPHGALGTIGMVERPIADAVARAIRAVDRDLPFLTIAQSEQVKAAEAAGLRSVAEIFADRGYDENGHLIQRGKPGAMVDDPEEAANRVVTMIEEGAIITATGKRVKTDIASICVHGDGAHAVAAARRVRERLAEAGIKLQAFAPA